MEELPNSQNQGNQSAGESKRGLGKPLIALIAAVAVIAVYFVSTYNGLVRLDETVKAKMANVDSQYKRRADLIGNLVETVKGYAGHESDTLTEVVNARAKATSTNLNVDNAGAMAEFQANQDALSSALSKLMVVVERYPDLKANQNFLELQSQLEGTENRINTARMDYNEAVRGFNTKIRSFPTNIVAGFFGSLNERAVFEASSAERAAPKVDFSK